MAENNGITRTHNIVHPEKNVIGASSNRDGLTTLIFMVRFQNSI